MEKTEILVVEDEGTMRRNIANELQTRGVRVITATDDHSGLRLFQERASSISAVITDVALRNEGERDRSGAEMARRLKGLMPDLPVYCHSAWDVSDDYPIFEDYFIKGDRRTIFGSIDKIVERAEQFDNSRFDETPTTLLDLKKKYNISDHDFFTLVGSRRMTEMQKTALLMFHRSAEEAKEVGTPSGDEPPTQADIFIVEPDSKWGESSQVRRPIPIVVQNTEETWIAELFGFPLIYTYADTREEAIVYLLKYLRESFETFFSANDDEVSWPPDMIHFGAFLTNIFG